MDINKVKSAFDSIKSAMQDLGGGPVNFYLDHLIECREEFFKRCAPFKIGDVVEITKKQNCDNGWKSSEHFLNVGNKAFVKHIDYYGGCFRIDIEPFNQTYFDLNGIKRPTDRPSGYRFTEDSLKLFATFAE